MAVRDAVSDFIGELEELSGRDKVVRRCCRAFGFPALAGTPPKTPSTNPQCQHHQQLLFAMQPLRGHVSPTCDASTMLAKLITRRIPSAPIASASSQPPGLAGSEARNVEKHPRRSRKEARAVIACQMPAADANPHRVDPPTVCRLVSLMNKATKYCPLLRPWIAI